MSKPEARVHLAVVDGKLNVYVDRCFPDTKTFEQLNAEGEWEPRGWFERRPPNYVTSPEQTKELVEQLTKAPA